MRVTSIFNLKVVVSNPDRASMVCSYTIGIQNAGTRMCKLFTCVNCRRETIVMFGRACKHYLGISRI